MTPNYGTHKEWILPFLLTAIVPDIDEIAAQAETMFAGRYSSIYLSLSSG